MAKMVTVQAQQMWEYMAVSRKTADYLVAELNEAGRLGWELINAAYHKDAKSTVSELFCWTAILKRPLILPAPAVGGETAAGDSSVPVQPVTAPSLASDMDASIFDVQRDDLDDDNGLS
ncbi:MAG: hypothetical protein JW719_02270 [Pirellulales bacterium]|nr:hypothetical protein [Pirellulales bacterium]